MMVEKSKSWVKENFMEIVLAEKVHNLGSDQLVIALTNSAPNATDATLSQLTEIAYTNHYYIVINWMLATP